MIIRKAAIDSHWYRASGAWFLSLAFGSGLAFALFDELGYRTDVAKFLAVAGVLGAFILYIIGKMRPQNPVRVIEFILVFGVFGAIPLICFMTFVAIGYFVLTDDVTIWIWIVRIAYVVCAVAWPIYALQGLRARLTKTRFIEKELRVEEERIVLSRTPKTNIDEDRIPDGSLLGRVMNRAAPLVGLFLFMGYPIQRLLTDRGGVSAVMLFLAIFLIPWSIHAIGQFVCGAYLWIYKVRELEKQHGKPVVFEA